MLRKGVGIMRYVAKVQPVRYCLLVHIAAQNAPSNKIKGSPFK